MPGTRHLFLKRALSHWMVFRRNAQAKSVFAGIRPRRDDFFFYEEAGSARPILQLPYRLKIKPRAAGRKPTPPWRRWRKHSVCMTNAPAGEIPSQPCRLRAETSRQRCQKARAQNRVRPYCQTRSQRTARKRCRQSCHKRQPPKNGFDNVAKPVLKKTMPRILKYFFTCKA